METWWTWTTRKSKQVISTDATELATKLPDPPAAEPKHPGEPDSKKQKTEVSDDDFVVVDGEEAKKAEAADKAD